jgi:hypothetical protein
MHPYFGPENSHRYKGTCWAVVQQQQQHTHCSFHRHGAYQLILIVMRRMSIRLRASGHASNEEWRAPRRELGLEPCFSPGRFVRFWEGRNNRIFVAEKIKTTRTITKISVVKLHVNAHRDA